MRVQQLCCRSVGGVHSIIPEHGGWGLRSEVSACRDTHSHQKPQRETHGLGGGSLGHRKSVTIPT